MNIPVRDLPTRYGAVAMSLHWLIAAAIIANLYIGLTAADMPRGAEKGELMGFHMALGLTVLVLTIARLVWRWMNPVPPPPEGLNRWIRISGRAIHHLLYVLMVAVPLAGWLMVSANGFAPAYFGLFHWPALPFFGGLDKTGAHEWHEFFESIHVTLAWSLMVLAAAHIVAGFYHYFVRRDDVLLRMLPGTKLRSDA